MNTQHTSGPWFRNDRFVKDSNGTLLAEIIGAHLPSERWFANAQLVVSAPDLLAALRLALTVLPRDGEAAIRARAAIAKAEGI